MEKKYYYLLLLLLPFLAACTGGGGKKNAEDDDSIKFVKIDSIDVPDIIDAVGTIGDGTSMNVLELITDEGDTLNIEMSNGTVVGGIVVGERVAVTYHTQNGMSRAMTSVNMSALQHLWAQPADDGHKQCIELNEGGRMSTYDMSIEYDAWALKDGKLLLYSPKKIASEQAEQADTFDIMQLTDESLVLMHGNMESEFIREN